MNNLAKKISLKEAVEKLMELSEEPVAGPGFLEKARKIFDVFAKVEDQEAIRTILEPHMPRMQALVLETQGLAGKVLPATT